ncbi:bifunctional peptidase and arginyl-hydroxylase JMJD5-like [Babylonia areolata]|uniref:bifunctional peptidase and arginyl-hydroxylase JMJD5-like n=1 Tax=Babylonia areolata TaxID=304850 RepID=UPI003FD0CCBE
MAEEKAKSMASPTCCNLGPLKDMLPDSASAFLSHVEDMSVLGAAFSSQLTTATQQLFSQDYTDCIKSCDVLLDKTWEALNTGYWKDVDINWRYAYTLLSVLKALSQCNLLSDSQSNIDHASILKTCDMGLLMGAPVMDNILAKMSHKFQESFGDQRPSVVSNSHTDSNSDTKVSPSKKARTSSDAGDISKETNSNSDAEKEESSLMKTVSKEREVPRCNCPSVEMFSAMFFDLQHPVVITGAIGYWPALTTHKWSLEYLQKIAGARTVPVEIGSRYTEQDWTQKLMTVNEFVEEFITSPKSDTKGYLAQHNLFDQITELKEDISIPVYCCLGEEEDVDINAWFGPCGTVSPLHHDPKHNFLCQVMGEKYVRLYSPDFTHHLYPHPDKLLANTSQVDCEHPDLDAFPRFAEALYLECVLKQGDMLYIPPKHWHYVKSLSLSFSVSFWWQ